MTAPSSPPSIMSGSMNWEPVRKRLLGTDLKDALAAACELREGIEIVHTVEFPLLLSALLPAFSNILAHRTKPNADPSSLDSKLRNTILEIICRMPSNETLRPHAPHLVAVALDILNRDYEENALLASRVIFDLYKVYRTLPQDYVQPYLDFVQNSYRTLPTSVQRNFLFHALAATAPSTSSIDGSMHNKASLEFNVLEEVSTTPAKAAAAVLSTNVPQSTPGAHPEQSSTSPKATTAATPPSSSSQMTSPNLGKLPSSPVARLSPRSNSSFRVLTECPLIVMLMFQLYPKFLRSNIPILINVMMEALALRAPTLSTITQAGELLDNAGQRLYFSRCRELVAAQAKTLSFLTYLLRGFSNDLKPYEDRLAANVVALMSTCPREFISTRKELLVATRHLLNSEFRNGFFRHVDSLLDERVLLGSHHRYSEQTILRPLGYTTLSDLVHHVRSLLNMNQMSRVVSMFARVLHDQSSLPLSTQYTAVRTLLSIVDIIFHNKERDPQIGRDILVRILKTLVDKLSALSALDTSTCSTESLRDFKSMIRAIVVGHKTLIWYINNYRSQREKQKIPLPMPSGDPTKVANEEVSSALLKITNTEHQLIDRYIVLAFPCMKCLQPLNNSDSSNSNNTPDPYRDALTYFAAAFTTLDGFDLRRTLGRRLNLLVEAIMDDPIAIVVPRHLLGANGTTSFEFCALLLDFLVERLDLLAISSGKEIQFLPVAKDAQVPELERLEKLARAKPETQEDQTKRSAAYLQLFERVLKSLSSFPDNERCLRPHLKGIVSFCLRSTMERSASCCFSGIVMDNHCMLLRYIFRSISAGKFEESYKELLPLIPTVLNGLWRVLQSTEDLTLGNIIIELLLTIPARLSSLLPHMNLLLRVITRALESTLGDLVNLGLRTLEFWVDNLNPEFLFPELTKQTRLFVQLMKALSHHLKPAPYPYGLLTLRLLGKLGGKNRRVLREPMEDSVSTTSSSQNTLSMDCAWALVEGYTGKQEDDVSSFALEIPISQCVQVLKQTATSSSILSTEMESTKKKSTEEEYTEENINLWEADLSTLDLYPYCKYAIQRTRKNQVQSAVTVLRSALTKLIDVHEADGTPSGKIEEKEEDQASPEEDTMDMQSLSWLLHQLNQELQLVGLGLFFAATEGNDHLEFAKGLLTHSLMIVFTHQDSLVRVDANGSAVVDTEGIPNLGSLKPFGYCKHTHVLKNKRDPMILNHSLAEYLTHNSVKSVGLTLLEHILSLVKENIENRGAMIYVEHLLCVLIETCVKSDWNQRLGLYEAIGVLQQTLGQKWALQYEQELVYIAMISLKSIPKEMSIASIQAFDFFTKVCCGLYGVPCSFEKDPEKLVVDILCSPPDFISASDTTDEKSDEKKSQPTEEEEKQGVTPCNSVLETIITEMASSKQLVRIAARYMLKHYFVDQLSSKEVLDKFTKHLTLVKRVLFSRSLRLLPLPEQIGVVEALSTIVQQIPDLFVLDDQHLLAFLSELLKMSSVADGEMADANLTGDVIDKNGLAVTTQSRQVASSTSKPIDPADMTTIPSPPASALFLRRDCLLTTHLISQEMKHRIIIPQELPLGVQLRVSTISLLRFVIRGHANPFFDAETSTPIGNIRPHVISLLFRSLVSRPIKAVTVAHDALRDVLSLSVVSTPSTAAPIDATTTESKSKSRLRKELLQTCIRPVLLNLRDYSRLSPHLLRGLSRLLSLLSSWFNKTLGEKLLDHLQKWTDPNRMKAQKIWKEGQEPDVAAAIVDLFVLLPHAAHFVEPLVKTTIKLEACLPAFKSRHVISPYRKPLARYLNKHCQYTVPFFFQRLKTPLYSELFQDIITFQEESVLLREYLSGRQCSVSLLNICFERPLAIIRSEKTPASPLKSPPKSPPGVLRNTTELLFLHGIEPGAIPPSPKEVGLRQDLEARNKRVILLQQEYKRAQEFLKKSVTASSPLEDTKRKHQLAKLAFERAAKEFKDSKQRYTSEMTKIKAAKKKSEMDAKSNMSASARPMNVEAMELQHQGFRLVETLIQNNDNYLKEHNDVLRAFRWLWRSKGRYLRLQYDQSVPPRYHGESKLLASFLVDYSKQFPNDVDLLFELIRIFLQSSASDFSFVKQFLAKAVPNLSQPQKKQILQRFFVLLAGESTEEIKTLSIQLVVFPMLESSFHDQNHEEFIDAAEIEKFVQEVLFHEGKVVVCGNRLKIELLRLSNLFLESVPRRHLEEHGKDLIKFCWTLLKSDDTACKSWAYLVVCRFASVLDTPSKLILQVYVALLRAHQQEGKDLVREALDLLVPALSKRLKDKDKKKMVEYTNRIMFEEGNSVPQLAHIWHVIVKHPAVFYQYRNQFVRYMINSLNRLGLPPNCPPENRVLSVSIVELVTQWDNESTTSSSSLEENFESSKRSVEETNDTGSILPQSAEKKQKTLSGSVDVFRKESTESLSLLDQSMVCETVV
jgi:transformation/transcription domain-associated protein